MEYIFFRNDDDYINYLNPVEDSIEQYTDLFSKRYSISKEQAKSIVLEYLSKNKITNPIVKFKSKQSNEDMEIEYCKLTEYLNNVKREGDIIAPSFTVYKHPSKEQSIVSLLLNDNVKLRSVNKKKMFEARMAKDLEKASYYNTNQQANKIENNSASGGFASNGTVIYNPSAHYTLTSATRCVSGVGNAISESIVGGNKYFRTPEVLHNYIATIVSKVDINNFKIVMDKYKLHYPTAKEVMSTITRVTRWYWASKKDEDLAYELLDNLDPVYRAAFTYINDLWNLKEFNDSFVRNLLGELHKRVETGSTNPLEDLNDEVPGTNTITHYIYAMDIKGLDVKYKDLLEKNDPLVFKLASTAKHIKSVLISHKDLFNALFVTDILPTNVAYIQDMLRFNIVLSDTDSTCCSYSKWVDWYYGRQRFDNEGIGLSAAVMVITTQAMDHNLKVFSKNMNFGKKDSYKLQMKNEFFWPVFVTSDVTKHYFANTMIQEGNVYDKNVLEKKGVHFIASTISSDIVKQADDMMVYIMEEVAKGNKISIYNILKEVSELEQKLIKDIEDGKFYMFRKDTIKEEKAYKQDKEESKYINYTMWMEIFSERYGVPNPPPYVVYTIGLNIETKKQFLEMLAEIEKTDPDIAKNMRLFCQKHNREIISTLRPPKILADSIGIPKCFKPYVNVRETVLQTVRPFDYILKTLGFYRKPGYYLHELGFDDFKEEGDTK